MAERDKPVPGEEPTDEELAASARLRDDLSARASTEPRDLASDPLAELAHALHAAWSPSEIDPEEHRALAEAGLNAEDAPLTDEELAAAERLRESLEASATGDEPAGELAHSLDSLRAAWAPRALRESEHRAVVERALESASPSNGNVVAFPARRARGRTLYAATAGVVAMAAGIILWLNTGAGTTQEAPLAAARSTQSLFDEPFKPGEASARIDRIAVARASDFRENRFAQWGVR